MRDDGAGIATEHLETIFGPFEQGGSEAETDHGGLGIGLTLVRDLVHLHGGTVRAYSEGPGLGSEFRVTLPLAAGSDAAAPEQGALHGPATAAGPQRVLVVDDNPDAAESLAMLLSAMGATVETAHEGRTAIERIDGFRPHVVLLDIGMPEMNGYDVAAAIRAHAADVAPRLVAVTGWGSALDKARARAAGFDDHLTKPVEAHTLGRLLSGAQ